MDDRFFSIIDYAVDGPATQTALLDLFAEIQRRWVAWYPGYVSAQLFGSIDGTRVYNVVTWASEADYRRFEETSDTDGRIRAIGQAIEDAGGHVEPRMTGAPRFTLAHLVGPQPEPEA